jgi:hypothetical protein
MILYLAMALSFAIIITAAVWPVPYRIDRKLPAIPERHRRPF